MLGSSYSGGASPGNLKLSLGGVLVDDHCEGLLVLGVGVECRCVHHEQQFGMVAAASRSVCGECVPRVDVYKLDHCK